MNSLDTDYLNLMHDVYNLGEDRSSRAGGTRGLFGTTLEIDMTQGFPLLTTKEMKYQSVFAELAAFLTGSRSVETFREMGTKIWNFNTADPKWQGNPNCLDENDMGRIYGVQWRDWVSFNTEVEGFVVDGIRHTDQMDNLIDGLNEDPMGRRHLVTAWNPGELDAMYLPPCHYAFQCHMSQDLTQLNLMCHMRSVDVFLGMPFDIASYGLLMHLIAQTVKHKCLPGKLIFTFGDTHIYQNHFDQCLEQLGRTAYGNLPGLELEPEATVFNFKPEMANIINYAPRSAIKAPLN